MEIEVIYQLIKQRLFILLCFLSLILFIAFILYHKPAPDDQKVVQNTAVTGGKGGDTLVVLLHAYTARGDKLGEIREVLGSLDEYSDADFIIPDLPFGLFSMESSSKVTAELVSAIDQAWDNRVHAQNPYKRVILIGHSMGALYARKLFVVASGENEDARFESDLRTLLADSAYDVKKPRPWAHAVDRIIQLAGMNRGWSISHHMSIPRAIQMEIGVIAGRIFEWVYGRPPIIFTIRRGAPFITQLRLQWLEMKKQAHEKGL
ncbi:MAG: alpha/beta hydrolase, partial [Candidatus Thiodiazotropha taylori]|nr:alpha/beta hydrolase [Candidatus Thiodiazotropha taylori]